MKLHKKLISKPLIFQRTFGMTVQQFMILVNRMHKAWELAEIARKSHDDRCRKIGGGRPYKYQDLSAMLIIVLLYYKTYLTQEFVGIIAGLDQSNVSRLLKKMLPLIEQVADPELATYLAKAKEEYASMPPKERINNWAQFIEKHPDLKAISTDATEQQCYRSKNYETQKKYYSGKTKQHSLKTQISVSATGRVLDVSETYPGSVHDKKIIDQENTIQKFPEKTCQRMDSGYQGVIKDNKDHYLVLPHKKPKGGELTQFAKDLNRSHSQSRVIVEHIFSRFKKFKICAGLYRGQINHYNQVFRNIAALLNFRLQNSMIIM